MTTSGIIFFICLFIGLFALIMYSFNDFNIWWEKHWLKQLLLTPVYAVIAFIVELMIFIFLALCAYPEKVIDETTQTDIQIYSIGINDSYSVEGSFVLGCGLADGESYPIYRFYEMNDDGMYVLNEVNAKNFSISLTDGIEPYIHVNATRLKMVPKRLKWIFGEEIHTDCQQKNWSGVIYLPINAIVKSYELKL